MKKLYIIKAGKTFENIISEYGDFEDWILKYIDYENVKIIDIQNNEKLPSLSDCLGVIITGSHSMVTQELPWSLKLETFINEIILVKIPFLGICYGHQLLAKSLGAKVDYHPKGIELGTVDISVSKDALNDEIFKYLPSSFDVHVVHAQSALTLPKDAVLLASNNHEENHAFRVGQNAWGVQFHPEYDENVMKGYIKEVLRDDDEKKNRLLEKVKQSNHSNEIIKLFVNVAKASNY
jgi:GMP synthase (glutamine-hydrolysing)